MNLFKKSLVLCVAMAAGGGALAKNANLEVTGKIKPVSCEVSFDGEGKVNYGEINVSTLEVAGFTSLGEKEVSYNIRCGAKIAIATAWRDQRPQTAEENGDATFGLGTVDGHKIGSYSIVEPLGRTTGDNGQVSLLKSGDNGKTWGAVERNYVHKGDNAELLSYTNGGEKPGLFQFISSKVIISAYIAPLADLSLGDGIDLDGLATMEVKYL